MGLGLLASVLTRLGKYGLFLGNEIGWTSDGSESRVYHSIATGRIVRIS